MVAKCISLKRNETVWLALTIRSLFLLNVCEQGIHIQTVFCGDFLKCNKFWTVKTLEHRKFWTVKISDIKFWRSRCSRCDRCVGSGPDLGQLRPCPG